MIYYDFMDDRGYNYKTVKEITECAQDVVNVKYYDGDMSIDEDMEFVIGKFDDDVSEDEPLETFILTLSPDDEGDDNHSIWHSGAGGVL